MSRDRWLIVTASVVMILAMTLFVFSVVTDRRREVAVEKWKAKRAEVFAQRASGPVAGKKTLGQAGPEAAKTALPGEDTVSAFKRVFEALAKKPVWREFDELAGKEKPKEWTEADRKKVAEYLAANGGLIKELRRLAELGGPTYELDYSKGFAMELPHLGWLLDCTRLLAADAALQAFEGNPGEAIEDLLAGMKLAGALAHEPTLLSQLVRVAMDGIVCSTVEQAIHGEDLTPELSGRLIEYASQASRREAFANSLSGEGLSGLHAFDEVRTGDLGWAGMRLDELRAGGRERRADLAQSTMDSFMLHAYGSVFARPLLNMEEASYADLMGRMGDAARLPFYEAKPLLDEIGKDIDDLPRSSLVSRMTLLALPRQVGAQARHEARLDLMRVGLAVEQYHAQNGTYPQTLDAIAPAVGGAVPLDPFTGKPFVYQPSDDSFTLHSVMGLPATRYLLGADENGNLVWREPH